MRNAPATLQGWLCAPMHNADTAIDVEYLCDTEPEAQRLAINRSQSHSVVITVQLRSYGGSRSVEHLLVLVYRRYLMVYFYYVMQYFSCLQCF